MSCTNLPLIRPCHFLYSPPMVSVPRCFGLKCQSWMLINWQRCTISAPPNQRQVHARCRKELIRWTTFHPFSAIFNLVWLSVLSGERKQAWHTEASAPALLVTACLAAGWRFCVWHLLLFVEDIKPYNNQPALARAKLNIMRPLLVRLRRYCQQSWLFFYI